MKSIKAGVGFTWASTGVPGLAFVLLLACSKTNYQFASWVIQEGNSKCTSNNFFEYVRGPVQGSCHLPPTWYQLGPDYVCDTG